MPENINYVITMTSQYNYLPIQKERYEHELQKVRSSSARSQAKSALTVFELKDENTKLLEENTKLLSEKAPDHEGSVLLCNAPMVQSPKVYITLRRFSVNLVGTRVLVELVQNQHLPCLLRPP